MSGLLAIDPAEPGAGEPVEEKQACCPESKGSGLELT